MPAPPKKPAKPVPTAVPIVPKPPVVMNPPHTPPTAGGRPGGVTLQGQGLGGERNSNRPATSFVMPVLSVGMKVEHTKFGVGTVIKIHTDGKKINVAFTAGGEKAFVAEKDSPNKAFRTGFLKVV